MKIENYKGFIERFDNCTETEKKASEMVRKALNKRRPFTSLDSKPIYFIDDMH